MRPVSHGTFVQAGVRSSTQSKVSSLDKASVRRGPGLRGRIGYARDRRKDSVRNYDRELIPYFRFVRSGGRYWRPALRINSWSLFLRESHVVPGTVRREEGRVEESRRGVKRKI